MDQFIIFFRLGLEHILDIKGLDHMLFVIALCATVELVHWRKLLTIITAFTVGHSLTLALSILQIIEVNADLIEILIPVTILITAIINIACKPTIVHSFRLNYLLAMGFGLIHGLGFSYYLQSLLGKDTTIINQLLAFNIGLECGQIIIVAIFLLIGLIFLNIFKVNKRDWALVISAAIGSQALTLIVEKLY